MSLQGQSPNNSSVMGLPSLSDEIYHLRGNTATLIEKGSGSQTVLYLHAEVGNFRLRLGDRSSSGLAASTPGASVTDGTGSFFLAEGQVIAITAPDEISAIGSASGAVLTYWWV